jgi:hypothetical protein
MPFFFAPLSLGEMKMIGGIQVVHDNPQTIWVPIEDAATIYVGGLATVNQSAPTEGITMLPDASGVANVSNHDVPMYVVQGTNLFTPLFDTTYKCEYITAPAATDPHDGSANDYRLVEGPYSLGDPIAMAKVAIITPTTVLRAPLYNAAVGTAPTVVTVTTGDTQGLGCTTGAADFTSITSPLQTAYFRSGANAGVYRMKDDSSTTIHTWDTATKNDIAVGDTLVVVPLRTHGPSTVMFDATSASFIDVADAPVLAGTNRWAINVLRLDLSEAGNEYCEFMFDAGHFGQFITNA